MTINIPTPGLQIDFAAALKEIRQLYLQDALFTTVKEMDITKIDRELAHYVPEKYLQLLAGQGLRAEIMFPVPCVLKCNPRLIGYYRLLLGFSQKAFYGSDFGISTYKKAELKGNITDAELGFLPELCAALIDSACALLDVLSLEDINPSFLDDLSLLTVGPQLRGGVNVNRGQRGTTEVFNLIHNIVSQSVTRSKPNLLQIRNAAGRIVRIEFSSDPDIKIIEEMSNGETRNIIAIEIKAGQDFSNIHNRIGEAEKSHQKAKQCGYAECWTVVNVDRINTDMAKTESPSTDRLYIMSELFNTKSKSYDDFKSRIISLTSIKVNSRK